MNDTELEKLEKLEEVRNAAGLACSDAWLAYSNSKDDAEYYAMDAYSAAYDAFIVAGNAIAAYNSALEAAEEE